MSNNLLKQLEEKIKAAIETIELSRMEINDLKEKNDELENRYLDWEERLSALIEKFEQLEVAEDVDIETTIQKVEEVKAEEVKAEEVEAEEVEAEEVEAEEVEAEEVEAEEVEAEEVEAEEVEAEEVDTEGPIFGTSVDSYTEAPGSTQHYA